MIYATVSMTVENGEAKCDEKIHLCRGDKNVELRFILENPFVVANTTYAQMIIKRPSTMPIFSEKAAIENNVVIFSITEDMIDELSEIGAYDIQIRLYDDLNARVTLPPVSAALEITEAIASQNEVGTAAVGYSMATITGLEEDTFTEDGSYNATEWVDGDIISAERLNKVEDALYIINNNIPNHDQFITEDELEAKGYLTEHQSLAGYATESYVNQEIEKIDVTEQLTDYAKKSDIPTKVSQLTNDSGFITSIPSEYVTDSELTTKGYATEEYVDDKIADFSNNDTLLENVAEKVPYVKVAEHPICVNSVDEMTDITKMYVLNSDGTFYSYKQRTITTEGIEKPNFTNVMESSYAYIKDGYRYSHSSQAFSAYAGACSVVVPTVAGTNVIRVRGAANVGNSYDNNLYWGSKNSAFPQSISNKTRTVEDNGDITLSFSYSSKGYIVFCVKNGVTVDNLIVTVNEEITYTVTGGGTQVITEWSSTGISYNQPADCESRVLVNENNIEELQTNIKGLQTDIAELEDEIKGNQPSAQGGGIEIVDSEEEFTDTNKVYVLPSGKVYTYTGTGTGTYIPNFTNLLDEPTAYTELHKRWSLSEGTWVDTGNYDVTSYVIPVPQNTTITMRIKNHYGHGWYYIYGGATSDKFTLSLVDGEKMKIQDELATISINTSSCNYITFVSETGYVEVVTIDEEITYTYDESTENYEWVDTGFSFVKGDLPTVSNISTSVFDTPAYAPVPQLPADGSEDSDFSVYEMTTQKAYDYMDALCNKYTQYITKQTMGKDASGTYDHNRYILCKAYWRAWQRENYPRMFAWKNENTIIYSVSVSPRVNDSMYSTTYVGTVYAKVTSVNCTAGTLSTRTVNGLVFTRYEEGDVEPTIVYTKPPSGPTSFVGQSVLDSSFSSVTTVSSLNGSSFVGADGITYTRYPFEDRKVDKSKPLSIFILANEHGYKGDDLIPSLTVMRIAKDLCKNTENPFLKWLKENCMITMIPVGTPWGYARYLENESSGYYNYNGVNINRNYDTPGWANSDTNYGSTDTFGAYAGCENETQHIMNTMRLCKADVGMSCHSPGFATEYKDMPDNAYFIHQGKGYDTSRVNKIAEALYSNYGMGRNDSNDMVQHYNNCGKSPAYIQYTGAVGGLIEIVPQENNTNNTHTSIAMEQSYTQILLFLQAWCEEALEKKEVK